MGTPKPKLSCLKNALEEAIFKKSRYYAEVFSFSMRFEADDSAHYQSTLKMLELPPAKKAVLATKEEQPGWFVQNSP